MSQWLPSSGQQWIVQLVVIAILGVVARGYFTASAEARLLDDQLTVALDSVDVVTDSLVDQRAISDALIAAQDSAQAADTAAVNAAVIVSDSAATDTDLAIAGALELATQYPVIRDALILAQTELREEREARAVERAESAAAVFAGQQRERVLGNQLISERGASDEVIAGLRASLSISMQESDAWERAATPGALRQIWQQGRWVVLAVGAVLIIK